MKFTPSQIRYLLWLSRLSADGCGVKNVALSKAMAVTKPSVHHMLRSFCEMQLVEQESFHLAHLTEKGRRIARRYEVCCEIFQQKLSLICGCGEVSEVAVCTILADLSDDVLESLFSPSR